jgi:aminoglycoside phosphotransferase (APT) family kinase protein
MGEGPSLATREERAAHQPVSAGVDLTDNEAATITGHLQRHASGYWPRIGASEPKIELERVERRSAGRLYWYVVRLDGRDRSIVVKVVDPRVAPAPRLRLAGLANPSDGFRREYAALRMIDQHFDRLADNRVGHVPILDRIEPSGAIVMERVEGTPMERLLNAHHRFGRARDPHRLMAVANHAGVWLREFHSVPVPPTVVDRARRDEFVATVDRYCDHLGRGLRAVERFRVVSRSMRVAAERSLPAELPIAVSHGDFAKRNVLVQGASRVLALDTLARRHAPIYEDIASFTVGVRFGRLQLQTHGLAFQDALLVGVDEAFLDGYFGTSSVPMNAFRTYELLVLLDRWAAVLTWESRGLIGRLAGSIAHRLLGGELRRSLSRLS